MACDQISTISLAFVQFWSSRKSQCAKSLKFQSLSPDSHSLGQACLKITIFFFENQYKIRSLFTKVDLCFDCD